MMSRSAHIYYAVGHLSFCSLVLNWGSSSARKHGMWNLLHWTQAFSCQHGQCSLFSVILLLCTAFCFSAHANHFFYLCSMLNWCLSPFEAGNLVTLSDLIAILLLCFLCITFWFHSIYSLSGARHEWWHFPGCHPTQRQSSPCFSIPLRIPSSINLSHLATPEGNHAWCQLFQLEEEHTVSYDDIFSGRILYKSSFYKNVLSSLTSGQLSLATT